MSNNKATILLTGCLGTLGKPLWKALREKGYRVFGCDLVHYSDPEYFRCDISNYRELAVIFKNQKFDYVYHLAAEFGRQNGEDYFEKVWETNVIGMKNIIQFQKEEKFKLIFTSSSEIYGETKVDLLDEDLPLRQPLFQTNDYAISKWVNELQIINSEKRYGVEGMRLRLFNAFGPGEYYHPYRSVVCLFCYKALNKMPYQVYENYHRVFMYIDDLIPTLVNAIEKFKPGEVYNIGGEEYRSVKELSDFILDYLGLDDSLVEYLPEDKHNIVNKRPNIEKAKRDLGHNPKTLLKDGIPKTIEWLRQMYKIN